MSMKTENCSQDDVKIYNYTKSHELTKINRRQSIKIFITELIGENLKYFF
jgi:hypothetical protein